MIVDVDWQIEYVELVGRFGCLEVKVEIGV